MVAGTSFTAHEARCHSHDMVCISFLFFGALSHVALLSRALTVQHLLHAAKQALVLMRCAVLSTGR
jgi:hypothetical protein